MAAKGKAQLLRKEETHTLDHPPIPESPLATGTMEQGRTQAEGTMSNSIDALLNVVAGLAASQQSQRNEINTRIEELRKSRTPSEAPEPTPKRSYDLHEVEDTHILQRLQKTIKQKWDKPKVILDGSNFLKWKQTIRSDAMLINAADILNMIMRRHFPHMNPPTLKLPCGKQGTTRSIRVFGNP